MKIKIEHDGLKKEMITVIYKPDCNCSVEKFVILDKFPMMDFFIDRCPMCENGCLMRISDPIMFHVNLGSDMTLEEVKNMEIKDTWQRYFLEKYKNLP